ncbi:WD40 repeat domain-containing protein [Bacillus sp. FJAT-49732]|uniref:WD40 repeat domain-containing protein n=1 Tax=Lederbergia citrisecunda TaxID=2833583 RepID=A0A942YJ46_9BACI|nr:WD40 repeat domain-containing protein [Lederbergia citrisecunda]MBS4198257.1 WD40 repeat domain-containing protein [Lederbergia citrisecunda]
MKIYNFITTCTIAIVIFLTGCQEKKQTPITDNKPFVATLNVRENSMDFVDENGEELTKWNFNKMYTGGFLHTDGDTLVLYGPEADGVDFYSVKTGKIGRTIKTGKGIVNGTYIRSISKIAFADKNRNEIRFFDGKGRETNSVKTDNYPMAMAADDQHLYVAAFQGERLSVINLNTIKITDEIAIPSSSVGMLLREDEKELWIGGHGVGNKAKSFISVFSLKDRALKEEIPAPLMPVDFYENKQGIYALSHGTNMLYRFNHDKQLIQKIEVGANPFSINFFHGKLIVAGFDSEELYWIDPDSLKIEMTTKVGKGPFVIFVREKVK